jgi:hypothetical protein
MPEFNHLKPAAGSKPALEISSDPTAESNQINITSPELQSGRRQDTRI